MQNGINNSSPKIRDFLLSKNLILSDTITNNGLSGVAVGLGKESSLNALKNVVQASNDIEKTNPLYRESQILKNKYISIDDMVSASIIDNSFSYKQINGGYITKTNKLNLGGHSSQPYDILGSIISGKGFGLNSKGISTQFDSRSSLVGRALLNETKLGIISSQQLLLALGQRTIFNLQKEVNSKIDLNVKDLFNKSGKFLSGKKSFDITVSKDKKFFDSALGFYGFEKPKSIIGSEVILNSENYSQNLINYTGKGQLNELVSQLNKGHTLGRKYGPNYTISGDTVLSATKSYKTKGSNDYLINSDGSDFTWGQGNTPRIKDTDSLLQKTKDLFKNNKKLLNYLFSESRIDNNKNLSTSSFGNSISKGSGVINGDNLMGASNSSLDNVFCRSWTSLNKYDKVSKLQKHGSLNTSNKSGLINYKNKIRKNIDKSVLDNNGFVKITPYRTPQSSINGESVKKYMFSIENLAWNDKINDLPQNEIGDGDKITGTKGRIMWFPPYDMSFSESSDVKWDTLDFIGRGEPIYTYNNTQRGGNLKFKIIIDYPDYLNNPLLNSDEIIASIASGCLDYEKYFSINEISKIKSEDITTENIKKNQKQVEPQSFSIYFPNNVATIFPNYEILGTEDLKLPSINQSINGDPNQFDYGLNKYWESNESGFTASLNTSLINDCSACDILIKGFASARGSESTNLTLSKDRAENVKQWFINFLGSDFDIKRIKLLPPSGENDAIEKNPNATIDSLNVKKDRKVTIEFKYIPDNDTQIKDVLNNKKNSTSNISLKKNIQSRFHNEGEYFQKMLSSGIQSDKIIYKSIKDQIKFFQPAFHSITPEGFNSRLTFLKQCTRQGPTLKNTGAQNLAFGSPPVCILRVGDFYNTKIIINNLNLTYDPLVWDLNPEGVGVQPMIANVTLGFKFIGGSSLNGPINELQNAVSFNYFGNTEIYDPRSKTIGQNNKGETVVTSGVTSLKRTQNNKNYYNLKDIKNNQEKIADISNSKIESNSVNSEPNILGFSFIEILDYNYGIESVIPFVTIKLTIKTENIIGNENNLFFDDLSKKSLKVSLISITNNEIFTSEIMGDTSSNINKSIKDGVAGTGYYLGDANGEINLINSLPILPNMGLDKYNLVLNYNGKKIQTIPVEIKLGGFTFLG